MHLMCSLQLHAKKPKPDFQKLLEKNLLLLTTTTYAIVLKLLEIFW